MLRAPWLARNAGFRRWADNAEEGGEGWGDGFSALAKNRNGGDGGCRALAPYAASGQWVRNVENEYQDYGEMVEP